MVSCVAVLVRTSPGRSDLVVGGTAGPTKAGHA